MDTKKPTPTGPGVSSRAKPITVLAITMGVAAAGILSPFVSGWESGGKPATPS